MIRIGAGKTRELEEAKLGEGKYLSWLILAIFIFECVV